MVLKGVLSLATLLVAQGTSVQDESTLLQVAADVATVEDQLPLKVLNGAAYNLVGVGKQKAVKRIDSVDELKKGDVVYFGTSKGSITADYRSKGKDRVRLKWIGGLKDGHVSGLIPLEQLSAKPNRTLESKLIKNYHLLQ
mmetsp:Transcript_50275/g.116713  ORF Transcript_50275/g.116713 Transcript_50275/m.116713 type:complete len:140 (+) Transcript_50275:78-497(+)